MEIKKFCDGEVVGEREKVKEQLLSEGMQYHLYRTESKKSSRGLRSSSGVVDGNSIRAVAQIDNGKMMTDRISQK